ncbi:MAG: hypothetical protein ACFB01_14305 [Cohaesibacteraceae bacterium]
MSGLSLADMRRLGAEKNAEQAKQGVAAAASKLPKMPALPFKRNKPEEPLAPPSALDAMANEAPKDELACPRALSGMSEPVPQSETKRPEQHLRTSLTVHTAVGGAAGAVLGAGAATLGSAALGNLPLSTVGLGALVGAVGGAGWGQGKGRSAQSIDWQTRRTYAVGKSKSGELYGAFDYACKLAALDTPRWSIDMDGTAAIDIAWTSPDKASATIGWPLVACLTVDQIAIVAAHKLAGVKEQANARPGADALPILQAEKLASVGQPDSLLFKLTRSKNLSVDQETAMRAWAANCKHLARHGDTLVARTAGPRALTEALLAQSLVAGLLDFLHQAEAGPNAADPAKQLVESATLGFSSPELDRALHLIAATPEPTPAQWLNGLPFDLLERLTAFDTRSLTPGLPTKERALLAFPVKEQAKIARHFSKATKGKKAEKAKAHRSEMAKEHNTEANNPSLVATKPQAAAKSSLFGFLKRKAQPTASALEDMSLGEAPLYKADALFQSDKTEGLKAYKMLVNAHPRWALARLRLAEAQIECGLSMGVGNLKLSAEGLPSALPSILDHLQSALPMVSPLEEEPIRQIVSKLQGDAASIAEERAEIDLDRLGPPSIDQTDTQTLIGLFETLTGLREVWVLSAPCAHMPDVPHHALLGLAPRLSADAAQQMAITLAEHAAIKGTVAVYIETGKPAGALGDVLASQPSLWRMGAGQKRSKAFA